MKNTHLILYLFLSIVFPRVLFGQNPETYNPETYSEQIVDTTIARFFYKYTFAKDAQKEAQKSTGLTVLEVGHRYLKFMDFFTLKTDSLSKYFYEKGALTNDDLEESYKYYRLIAFRRNMLINLKKGVVIVQGFIDRGYQYRTELPKLKWQLTSDTKTIKDHTVQKATTQYGGRNWVAWFSKDFKQPYGPYIFEGLPGLIFEIYDTEDNFHFLLMGTAKSKAPLPIYLRNEDRIKKTTERKYKRLNRAYHHSPDTFDPIHGTINGKEVHLNSLPYNPIEKE